MDKYFRIDYQDPDMLGDAWLFGAITNLAINQELLCQVVPVDQNFLKKQYYGVFHFRYSKSNFFKLVDDKYVYNRFWQYGKWVEIVIDDRLPTCNGRLIYMCKTKFHEFWGALLEKAYAK